MLIFYLFWWLFIFYFLSNINFNFFKAISQFCLFRVQFGMMVELWLLLTISNTHNESAPNTQHTIWMPRSHRHRTIGVCVYMGDRDKRQSSANHTDSGVAAFLSNINTIYVKECVSAMSARECVWVRVCIYNVISAYVHVLVCCAMILPFYTTE